MVGKGLMKKGTSELTKHVSFGAVDQKRNRYPVSASAAAAEPEQRHVPKHNANSPSPDELRADIP